MASTKISASTDWLLNPRRKRKDGIFNGLVRVEGTLEFRSLAIEDCKIRRKINERRELQQLEDEGITLQTPMLVNKYLKCLYIVEISSNEDQRSL